MILLKGTLMKGMRSITILFAILLFSSIVIHDTTISKISHEKNELLELYVDQSNTDGPWDGSSEHPFHCISDAINISNEYDIIFVMNGSYVEHLCLDFPISLVGLATPTLKGGNNGTIVEIRSNDIHIENFIVEQSGGYPDDSGILFFSGENISIEDCIIHHTKNALKFEDCNNVSIKRCFFSNNGNGLYIEGSSLIDIERCDFAHNAIAIVTIESNTLFLIGSTFNGNGISALFYQGNSFEIKNCNLSDNSVNKGGFILTNITGSSIHNCLFYHNGDGISLSNCNQMLIRNCTFLKNTHFAVSLRSPSFDITISSCILSESLRTAVYVEPGNKCAIKESHLVGNYLYSLSAEPMALYDASENWWGTPLGPFHPSMFFSNKIKGVQWIISSIPWSINPFQDVGASMKDIPLPLYDMTFDDNISFNFEGNDTDFDGVPDWWEIKWGYDPVTYEEHNILDPDGDALTNLEECYTDRYGSDPFKRDIFLEIDWMQCPEQGGNRPNETLIQNVIDLFEQKNISLHIDIGSMGGGEPIPNHCDHHVMYPALEDLYWKYFLHNDITNPRKGIFHYGIICNYCPDLNFPFMGWDAFDGFAVSAEWLEDEIPWYEREQIIVGGLVHHLGHTLGLVADVFPGIDNVDVIRPFTVQWIRYHNYESSMNYLYKFTIFTYSDGGNGPGDFDDWRNIEFDFFKNSDFTR